MINEYNCEYVKICPICGDYGIHQLGRIQDYHFNTLGAWELSHCNKCKHSWLSKRVLESFISLAYENYYTHKPSETHVEYKTFPSLTKFLSGNDAFDRFLSHKSKVLDIGCGNGDYLSSLIGKGILNCVGIDIDENAVKYCREKGLDVQCTTVEQFALSGLKFDIVVINHVLEHVYDVRGLFDSLKLLLDNNGLVCIRTPNNNSLSIKIFGRYWRGIEAPRHINLFSCKSLELAANKSNISSLENYTHNDYRLVRGSWIASTDAFLKSRGIIFRLSKSRLRFATILIALFIKLIGVLSPNRGEELIFVGKIK